MKNAMKKLLSLMLVAVLLVSAVPFRASADEIDTSTVVKVRFIINGEAQPDPVYVTPSNGKTSANVYDLAYHYFIKNQADPSEYTFDGASAFRGAGAEPVTEDDSINVGEAVQINIKYTPKPTEEVPPEEPKAPEVKPIEIIVKVDSSDNVVWTGEKVPANGESAKVEDLLHYCWNSSWDDVYNFDHAWSNAQQKQVALTGSINAGDTVYIMVTKKAEESKPTEPKPTEPEINDSVDVVVGNGDKRILVTLDWNVTGMKNNYVRVTDPNTKMGTVMEAIQKSGLIPTRTNYTFAGWYWDDDFDYPVKDNEYVTDSNTTNLRIYARWTRNASADNVFLKIYLNGKTSSPAKIVDISSYGDADGSIDIYEAKRAAGNYYSSTGYDGLFTDTTWNGGAYNNSDQSDSIAVNANGDTFIYIMLWGAKTTSTSSSSSSSSSTADTTNPKTGDTVYTVMTVMGLSVSALAAVYYVSKKRAF